MTCLHKILVCVIHMIKWRMSTLIMPKFKNLLSLMEKIDNLKFFLIKRILPSSFKRLPNTLNKCWHLPLITAFERFSLPRLLKLKLQVVIKFQFPPYPTWELMESRPPKIKTPWGCMILSFEHEQNAHCSHIQVICVTLMLLCSLNKAFAICSFLCSSK